MGDVPYFDLVRCAGFAAYGGEIQEFGFVGVHLLGLRRLNDVAVVVDADGAATDNLQRDIARRRMG
jgi:hypothetical protein